MSPKITQFYEFANFRLDCSQKVLLCDEKPVPLTPKVFDTLEIFLENAGRLLEKDDLMQQIWQDRFVEESNLTSNIKMLRKALGDDAANPRFIETIPRRGYRFIADVRRMDEDAETREKTDREIKTPSSDNSHLHILPFPQSQEIHPAASVVALADWRHNEDSAPENANDEPAKLKLVPTNPVIKNKSNYNFYILTCLILVVLAGLGYGFYYFLNQRNAPAAFRMSNPMRLTSNGKTKSVAVAPDGRFVVYILDDEGRQSLRLKNVETGSDVEILPSADDTPLHSVTFSPDGNTIYFAAKGTLFQMPILGGLRKTIVQNFNNRLQYNSITFSPDKKQFAFIRFLSDDESAVIIANSDGSDERTLAVSKRPEIFQRSAAWSPDGKNITCTGLATGGAQKIFAVQVADGEVSSVPSPHWAIILQAAWQPDGKHLLVIATEGRSSVFSQIWSLSYSTGEASNITNDFNNYQNLSLTADGRSLAAVRLEQSAHIWVMSGEDSGQIKQLTHGIEKFDGIFGLNFSADGKIFYDTSPGGKGEVWTIDADGRNAKLITDESGSTVSSPDGKYVVFQSNDNEGVGLFRLNLSSGEKKRLTKGADVWATFSPDGRWIVFSRWGEQVALWKVSTEGGEEIKLTNFSAVPLAPAVSPDGKAIAFYWQKMQPEIALLPFDGGEITQTFKVPVQYGQGYGKPALQWTADRQAINYAIFRDGVSNIWRQAVTGGEPVQVTNFESGRIFNFAYSTDGKQIALSKGTFERDVIFIKTP